jgi:hypothetical protein
METLIEKYSRRGHPTVDELIAAQGLSFPRNPADLFRQLLAGRGIHQ